MVVTVVARCDKINDTKINSYEYIREPISPVVVLTFVDADNVAVGTVADEECVVVITVVDGECAVVVTAVGEEYVVVD